MSRINKQKHVLLNELGDNDFMPPNENQQFARVVKSRGNNLHEVEPADQIRATAAGSNTSATNETSCNIAAETAVVEVKHEKDSASSCTFLVSMPQRFRKNIWIKRDNFVVIEMISEGHKVKGEIVRVLMPEHVRQFKKDGIWPAKFDLQSSIAATMEINNRITSLETTETLTTEITATNDDEDNETYSDSDDDDLVRNTNGWHGVEESDTDSDESGSDCESDVNEKVPQIPIHK